MAWHWGDHQQKAFDKVKKMISSSPVLSFFDSNKEITIQCDASQSGIGAVLLQEGRPVTYASRSMNSAELHYAQIEKEALAILFACKKFEQFIYGKNVLVQTDHKPLEIIYRKSLMKAPKRLQRILLQLKHFNLDLRYTPGTKVIIADTLSRCYQTNENNEDSTFDQIWIIKEHNVSKEMRNYSNVKEKTLNETETESRKDNTM